MKVYVVFTDSLDDDGSNGTLNMSEVVGVYADKAAAEAKAKEVEAKWKADHMDDDREGWDDYEALNYCYAKVLEEEVK